MIVQKNKNFTLMDTNGRRNDVINALNIYLNVLTDLIYNQNLTWNNMPKSTAQYQFYKKALELSSDVFTEHTPYDNLCKELELNTDFKEALNSNNISWIGENADKYTDLIKKFDKGIEDRARHYTSNLVKMGFTDEKRNITPVGRLLYSPETLNRDRLENILPINNINIIYLRQLLKLKIFTKQADKYYSPFNFALYILLQKDRMSENEFLELVQCFSPYYIINDIEQYVTNYSEGNILDKFSFDIPNEIQSSKIINEKNFVKHFKNQKSGNVIKVYYEYYKALYEFSVNSTEANLDCLLKIYENNKQKLKKAFGCGKNIFKIKNGDRPSPNEFKEKHKELFRNDNINEYVYSQFEKSKFFDTAKEYSDTTKRIFKATGIIRFDNGYAELSDKELIQCIFDKDIIKTRIVGNIKDNNIINRDNYEVGVNSYYCSDISLSDILYLNDAQKESVFALIHKTFPETHIEEIPFLLAKKRSDEFKDFIIKHYPTEKVKEILSWFSDRSNDKKIKETISTMATVPTIYEYMVGIAWFYFSDQKIDLLNSFNLTLSADFEPLMHAGGGQGDIVIRERDKVVMLEVTLMNANSQKRGEWEPVLRHAVNLQIEEESKKPGRETTTFFIADEFDANTINIWKAVASVPLQSSYDKNQWTDNVIIMPINTTELSALMDKSNRYNEIITTVRHLFQNERQNFDTEWRMKFVKEIE